jgi:hypothetical protein
VLGRALGLDAATSMMSLYVSTQGKLAMSAALMANRITTCLTPDGHLRFRIIFDADSPSSQSCGGTVYEWIDKAWEKIGYEKVRIEDFTHLVKKGGTWDLYAKNMLVARWWSNVSKFFCTAAFGGAPVYLPGEIPNDGLDMDPSTGEVVVQSAPVPVEAIEIKPESVTEIPKFATAKEELAYLMTSHRLDAENLARRLQVPPSVLTNPTEEDAKKIVQLFQAKLQIERTNS